MARCRIGLNAIIAALSFIILGGFVLLHDSYLASKGVEKGFFMRSHAYSWGIITYWGIVFAASCATLHSILARPVQDLVEALKAVADGSELRVKVDSSIQEIQQLADAADRLVARSSHQCDEVLAGQLSHVASVARAIAGRVDPESRQSLLDSADRVDMCVAMLCGEGEHNEV